MNICFAAFKVNFASNLIYEIRKDYKNIENRLKLTKSIHSKRENMLQLQHKNEKKRFSIGENRH